MASTLMTSWNMVQVPFTMNFYLCCLSHLTMWFLLSSKDISPFLLSKSRQPMATLMSIPTISANHLEAELGCTPHTIQLWGEIDMSHRYLSSTITWHPSSCGIICFAFYILFCKGLEIMGSDKICTASCTYIHVLYLCHLYPLPFTWRITNENFQSIFVSCNSLHNFSPKRNEFLRYHCCLSQLYFIGH
jgi:hypothetical protein